MTDTVLRNVRPWGGALTDIAIDGGVIIGIGEATSSDAKGADARKVIDGRGLLAIPGFINAHAHLDKSWWGKPWVSYGGEATTQGRIAHERAHRDELGIPGVDVTTALLKQMVTLGTTAFRTHVDVDLGLGVEGIRIVREAIAAFGGAIHAEIVAFPQDGVLRRPGVLELLDQAAREGAEHIGGLDPASIDRDPVGQLDAIFEIADRRSVGVDIHLHDGGDLGAFQFELIIERTLALGLAGRVNIAHGFALGELSAVRQQTMIAALHDASISMTTVAPINAARLPMSALRAAGVRVGLGTDGIRDLWGPFGDGDLLALSTRLSQLSGWREDAELIQAARVATSDAATFVGRRSHDLVAGSRADIVLVDAENVPDAVVSVPRRELVMAGGRVVAEFGELVGTIG